MYNTENSLNISVLSHSDSPVANRSNCSLRLEPEVEFVEKSTLHSVRNLLLDSPSAVATKGEDGLEEETPDYPELSADYNMILNQMNCIKDKVLHVNSLLTDKNLLPYIRSKLCASVKLLQESFDRCKLRKAMLEDIDPDMNILCDSLEQLLQDVNDNMTLAKRSQHLKNHHHQHIHQSTCSDDIHSFTTCNSSRISNSVSCDSISDNASIASASTASQTDSKSIRKRKKSVSFYDTIEIEGKKCCINRSEPAGREGMNTQVLVDITCTIK